MAVGAKSSTTTSPTPSPCLEAVLELYSFSSLFFSFKSRTATWL